MTKVEFEIEFRGGIFFLEFAEYMKLTVRGSDALPPRTPTRTFEIAACLCVRRPSRLLPASGVRISRFLPACARRKQAQHVSCPSRTRGDVFESYTCAPPPDALAVPPCRPRSSPVPARSRAARDSLNAKRRARAARVSTLRKLSVRA